MFNSYAVRPIGSAKFFEHLKDIQTEQYYNTESSDEPMLELSGYFPWQRYDRHAMEGADELLLAVTAMTFIDYLDAYRNKLLIENEEGQSGSYWVWNSRCIALENEYFRKTPFLTYCFDKLLENVCWEGVAEIEKCICRMNSLLRWTKHCT
jgi:hypothetical protein